MTQQKALIGLVRTAFAVSAVALAVPGVFAQGANRAQVQAPATPPSLATLKATARSPVMLNPTALGEFSKDLVYTAVTPCRIVDTRNAVGPFTPGQTRTYDLDGTSGPATSYAAQGGVATTCNIPFGKATSAALNITVTSTTSPGFLTAWGLGTQPNASVLNWPAGDTIANTTIVPIVPGGGNDFSIYSSSGAQVIIDVVGYFAAPDAIKVPFPIQMGSETGTTQSPGIIGGATSETPYVGMVTRRVFSSDLVAGSIVARSPSMRLERNATAAGWQITILPTTAFRLSVRGTVVRANGTVGSVVYNSPDSPAAGLTAQIINNADDVVFVHLLFGDFYGAGNVTEVTLSRAAGDYFWVGNVISSFNQ